MTNRTPSSPVSRSRDEISPKAKGFSQGAEAPAHVYGAPDQFRALIDAAHAHNIAVVLDVVFNHFGPDGNYLAALYSHYFHPTHTTPWGAAFHFELPFVRQFFLQNITYWMEEFHVDGFRLDATHAIEDSSDVHVLTEIASIAQARGRFVIAEDDRNDLRLVTDVERGGIGLDGCWADDFHHVVNVMLTGNRDAYFKNYHGTRDELATTLKKGWLFTGQVQQTTGKSRGADPSFLRADRFVYCISNHDQVGNRAFGERLNHLVSPAAYRAASALFLLAPYTPLVFMGQEWAASSPFQFFTDHNAELGEKVIAGRRREFRDFAAFRDANVRETIPSPQAEETFQTSKLNWNEREAPPGKNVLNLYRKCIELRNGLQALRDRSRENWRVVPLGDDVVAVVYGECSNDCCVLVSDLGGSGISMDGVAKVLGSALSFKTLLDSNGRDFCDDSSAETNQPRTILVQLS